MKTYDNIQGWFNFPEVYNMLVASIPDSGTFVECGAWFGKSSAYLCDIAQDRINVYIIDTWKGSQNEKRHVDVASRKDIHQIFLDNMGDRKFKDIVSDGAAAASMFDDNTCDVVFIDMEHTYEAVKNDIQHWLPKVKIGGYLAGHDYATSWPGVPKAVNEIFGKENIIVKQTCWIYHKQ